MNIEKIQYENYYNMIMKKLNQKIVIHIINPKVMNRKLLLYDMNYDN